MGNNEFGKVTSAMVSMFISWLRHEGMVRLTELIIIYLFDYYFLS
jgi:hypothetical protein